MKKTLKILIMMIVIITLVVSMTSCTTLLYLLIGIEELLQGDTSETLVCSHPYSQHFVSDYIPASCTEEGFERYRCYLCWEVIAEIVLPREAHTLIKTEAVEPSCSPGYTYGEYCNDCGQWFVEPEVIPPIYDEHDWNGLDCKVEDCSYCKVGEHPGQFIHCNPTCEKDGYYAAYCYRCTQKVNLITYPATGHNYVDGVCINQPFEYEPPCGLHDPATCEHVSKEQDYDGFYYCYDCQRWQWDWEN